MIDVKKLRKQLGLSQSEMAKACNCHVMTISRWERGIIEPDGQAERLLELIAEMDGTVWMQWFRKRFVDQPGKPGHSN